MPESILAHLQVDGRFLRSVALDRDLFDEAGLDHYLITTSVVTALNQISRSIAADRAQRAWKIIGHMAAVSRRLVCWFRSSCACPRRGPRYSLS